MGEFAVACSGGRYKLYTLQKTNEFDSEKNFLSNWLFDRLEEEKNVKTDSSRRGREKKESTFKGTGFNTKGALSFPVPQINRDYIPLHSETIDDEIFIFTFKSPCALCLNSYLTFCQYYPKVKLNIYYSNLFKYRNASLIEKNPLNKLEIVKNCDAHYGYIKNYYNKRSQVIKCINKSVINFIKGKQVLPNLTFSQVSMNNSYDRIIGTIYLTLDLF